MCGASYGDVPAGFRIDDAGLAVTDRTRILSYQVTGRATGFVGPDDASFRIGHGDRKALRHIDETASGNLCKVEGRTGIAERCAGLIKGSGCQAYDPAVCGAFALKSAAYVMTG